jgi:hypothetical protein
MCVTGLRKAVDRGRRFRTGEAECLRSGDVAYSLARVYGLYTELFSESLWETQWRENPIINSY